MNNTVPQLLIVDDELHVRESLSHWFAEDGYDVVSADSGKQALALLGRRAFDIVITDIRMPGMDGLELQRRILEVDPDLAIIVITAYASVSTAVQALKEGAYDYLAKPFDPEELTRVIEKAWEKQRLRKENVLLKERLKGAGPRLIVGDSPGMTQVMELVGSVAPTETTVMIRGESGTGKELVARLIHSRSPRAFGPMVAVNCGALPEGILESELFGHEKGAFTGASAMRKGKLELADGGTLFLDEIGEISPKVQVELLRALDDKKVTRLGGNHEIQVDFRVVCATNSDLEQAVTEGGFREDLFYRINVFEISIPPLRDRPGDILPIADHYVRTFSAAMGRQVKGFSPEAERLMKSYSWPGNVRELANAVERALVVCRGATIGLEHLPISGHIPSRGEIESEDRLSLIAVEDRHIRHVLDRSGFNVSETARLLGIDRATLYNKMRKYGIERPE